MGTENVIKKLSEKISEAGIQRTKKDETRKGYDTDGYGYQYIVDRLNDVCGSAWGFSWSIIKEIEGEFRSGQKFWEVSVQVDVWVEDKTTARSCVGGHISASYADALKGAITNGFKKTAAFWGVGRDAYAGTIDDDNVPLPDSLDNSVKSKPTTPKVKPSYSDDPEKQALYDNTIALLLKAIPADTNEKEKKTRFEDLCGACIKDFKYKKLEYFTVPELKDLYGYLHGGEK